MVSSGALLAMRHCKRNKQKQKAAENVATSSNKDNPQPPEPSCSYTSQNLNLKSEQVEYSLRCRVCLNHGNIPIYGPEDMSEELNYFAGIHVTYNDAFPKYLCQTCNDLLQGAMLLKKTAQASEQFLRQHRKNAPPTVTVSDNNDHLENAINSPTESLSFEEEDNFEEKKNIGILKQKIKVEVEIEKKQTYHCVRCDLNFDVQDKYQEHLLTEEHDNPKKVCPICHKSYNYMYLKRHMVLHGKDSYKVCDVCGKHFPHHRLNRHRVTHFIKELPFKCSLCPYRGRFSTSLKMHMKTHTGEKQYPCLLCPYRFVNKSNLTKHMLTHNKERDFKCTQCSRGFKSKRDLELHYKIDHTGIKDFLCNLCGKSFGYRNKLMQHERKVHKRAKCMPGRTPLYVLKDEQDRQIEKQSENSF